MSNLLRHANDVSPNSNTSWFNPLACCYDVKDNGSDHAIEKENLGGSFNNHQVTKEESPQDKRPVGSWFEHQETEEESNSHYEVLLAAWNVIEEVDGLLKNKLQEIEAIQDTLAKTSNLNQKTTLENLLQLTGGQANKITSYKTWAEGRYQWLAVEDSATQDALKIKNPYGSRQWTLQEIKDDWEIAKKELAEKNKNALIQQVNPAPDTMSQSQKRVTFDDTKYIASHLESITPNESDSEDNEELHFLRDVPSPPPSPNNTPSQK